MRGGRRAATPELAVGARLQTPASRAREDAREEARAREREQAPRPSTSVHAVRWCWDHEARQGCRQWTATRHGRCAGCQRVRVASA